MLHIKLSTTNETSYSNLVPRKLTTCPTFHVRPTFADSPLRVRTLVLFLKSCSQPIC